MDITVSIARIELTRSLLICAASFKQGRAFRAPSCHHIAGDVFDPKWERERRIAANAPSLPEIVTAKVSARNEPHHGLAPDRMSGGPTGKMPVLRKSKQRDLTPSDHDVSL